MANHLDRPEIKSAVKNGTGTDTRFSDTIGTQDYYYALRLDDGNILRVSIQADSIFALFERSLVIIIVIIIGIVIVSMIASVKLTDKLVSPLKKIPELLRTNKTASDTDIYPEIVPLVEEIRSVRSSQSEMRQEFTANVSHELKTPLTSISGYAQVIENGMAQGEDCIRFAAKIRSESARMLTLISDIIRLSELDSEEVESLNDDIDLTQTARECREQLEPLAERRGIRITLSGEAETIKGSRTEIHELVYNLVRDLQRKIQDETSIPVQNLRDALRDRILVYSGGGSTYDFLTRPIDTFTDVRMIDSSIWREENVKDKPTVSKLSLLLTTAYGLSVCKDDEEVKLKSYSSLFAHLPKKHESTIQEISKDQC